DQKFGGAVEVVNQWGKDWGKDGFTFIRYADLIGFARYGYELFYTASCFPLPEGSVVIFDEAGTVIEDVAIANKQHHIQQKLKIGSKFRISIRAQTGAFIYFLTKDQNGVSPVFPEPKTHPYISLNITLPGKDAYYRLEGEPQTNQLYLIVSKRQIDISLLGNYIANNNLIKSDASNGSLIVNDQLKDDIRVALIEMEQF
ncbi:MAG: hypothetical protein RIF46_06960, partial [Cyclobacteriaceae bacterium]